MDIATECDNGSTSGARASHDDTLKCYLCRGLLGNTRKSSLKKCLVDKFLSESGLATGIDPAVATTPESNVFICYRKDSNSCQNARGLTAYILRSQRKGLATKIEGKNSNRNMKYESMSQNASQSAAAIGTRRPEFYNGKLCAVPGCDFQFLSKIKS